MIKYQSGLQLLKLNLDNTEDMYLSCKGGDENVYMLGFDLSEHDEPINNIYKGTDNYLSEESKGFNTDNWVTQLIQTFKDFPDTQFHWVVDSEASPLVCNNVIKYFI